MKKIKMKTNFNLVFSLSERSWEPVDTSPPCLVTQEMHSWAGMEEECVESEQC